MFELVPEVDHGELCQNDLIQPGSIKIKLFSFLVVFIDDVLLNNIQKIGVGYSHKNLIYFLLGVEGSKTVRAVF